MLTCVTWSCASVSKCQVGIGRRRWYGEPGCKQIRPASLCAPLNRCSVALTCQTCSLGERPWIPMQNLFFNYTPTCQNVPFFLLAMSQASQQTEQKKSAFVSQPSRASQPFTVITFPWFLLSDSRLVNTAAEIHYLTCSPSALSLCSF